MHLHEFIHVEKLYFQKMNVVLLLNCDAAYEKAGLRQAHNVLRQLCDNGNKVTIFGKWKRLNAHLNSRHAGQTVV